MFFKFFFSVIMYGMIDVRRNSLICILMVALIISACHQSEHSSDNRRLDSLSVQIEGFFSDSEKRLNRLNQQIESILDSNKQNREAVADIQANPNPVDLKNRYHVFDGTVYYNENRGDSCAYWYSGTDAMPVVFKKFAFLEQFEPFLKQCASGNGIRNHVYIVTIDNILVTYPYNNFRVYIPLDTDLRILMQQWFLKGDTRIWTKPYLDVTGIGYVSSYSRMISQNNAPLFHLTIDLSIPEIYRNTIAQIDMPLLLVIPPDYLIAANPSARRMFDVQGGERKYYLDRVKLTSSKYTHLDLRLNRETYPELMSLIGMIGKKKRFSFTFRKKYFTIAVRKIGTPGWFLVGIMGT